MKIESSNIQMEATSENRLEQKTSTTTNSWMQELNKIRKENTEPVKVTVIHDLSGIQVVFSNEDDLSQKDKLKKNVIEKLLERLTGEKKEIKLYPNNKEETSNQTNNYQDNSVNWGFSIDTKEEYYQRNSINYKSKVQINTKDGKSFDINLDISFSKQFHEIHHERLVIGNEKFADPLIINYKDDLNSFDNITNLKFAFDLNNDEKMERIPLLKDGAGFLALDKNNNGLIDNGHELFGPQTNSGFGELKKYDKDDNNWIDENDEIFQSLRIWEKNDKGDDKLITLSQAGIGAIYLASIDTNFQYNQSIDSKIAQLKQSSITVKEDGKTNLITEVDFTI